MESLILDLKHGLRSLLRDKGFTMTVVLTLAACVAVNTATFAIVNSVLLRPLPIPEASSIVVLSNRYPKAGAGDSTNSSAADYVDRLRQVVALEQQAMYRSANQTVDIEGSPERIECMAVTPSFFKLVRVAPALGRAFTSEEGEAGNHHKVILSDALWRQLYGGESSAVGRDLRFSGVPFTIVGVMPRDFVFVNPAVRCWVPLAFTAQEKAAYHSNNWIHIGRLKPGGTIAQVRSQVDALNATNLDKFPQLKHVLIDAGFHTAVEPLQDTLVRGVRESMYLLWGAAIFVLLIGGLNITNLELARLSVRGKEMATRLALGAGRNRVVSRLVVESSLLALAGGGAGVLLGAAVLRVMATADLNRFPRANEVRIDGTVIAVALGLAIVVGVVIGLAPLVNVFKKNLGSLLRDGNRTGTSGTRARRLRQGLVGAEIGLAFVLLAGAGLLLASFRHLLAVDPGFSSEGVLTASTNAPQSRYSGDPELCILMDRALETIRQLPGVAAAGATTGIPFGSNRSDSVILAEGAELKPGESVISPRTLVVTPGYFETMKIALLRGRYFEKRDSESAQPAIIIDEQLARHFWPGRDPIGRRMYRPRGANELRADANTRWLTVVGVVRSVRLEDLAGTREDFGAYYFPYAQEPSRTYTFAVRTIAGTGTTIRAVRAAVRGIDSQLALFDARTMVERAELSLASRRTPMMLTLGFGGLALFLSAIGIYGVLVYLVEQRKREIGIRMALGCAGGGVVKLVLREGMLIVATGLAAGLACAAALQRVIASQIYGVRPLDPVVIGSVAVLLGIIALAACAVPALNAMRVDPARVLAEQ